MSLLAAAYLAWAGLGREAAGAPGALALAWSTSGIALAGLLLGGLRLWPGIAVGAFLAAALAGTPVWAAGAAAAAHTLEAVAGAWLLRRHVGFRLSLDRTRDLVGLVVLAAGLASAVGATLGMTSLWLAGGPPGADYAAAWWTWWLRHAVGKLVVTPLVLIWSLRGWMRVGRARAVEAAALAAALLGVSGVVFLRLVPWPGGDVPVAYFAFPLIGWAALRFGQRGVALATFGVAAVATWGTVRSTGPFARGTLDVQVGLLHAFLAALALSGLGLAAVIARRRRVQDALADRTRQLEAVRAVAAEVTRELDPSTVLALVTRRAVELTGAGAGAVWLWNDATRRLERQTWTGTGEPGIDRLIEPGAGVVGTVAIRRAGIRCNDYRNFSNPSPEFLRATSATAVMAEPLLYGDRLLGVLAVNNEGTPRTFTEEDGRLLALFAAHATTALENARLHADAETRRREAEAIAEVARTVSGSLDLGDVLERVAEAARRLCESDSARVLLWDAGARAMVPRYFVGATYPGWDALRIEPGKGLGGQVLSTGRPVRTDNYAEDPRITKDYLATVRVEGAVAQMAVPIQSDGRIDGLLYLSNLAARPFTDRDEEVALRLADHAALAIRNARLYEESLARGQRLETLARVTRTVAASLEIEDVLKDIAGAALALVPGGVCDLWIVAGDRVKLGAAAGSAPGDLPSRELTLGQGIAGHVCLSGEPAVLEDVFASPRIARPEWLRADGIVSIAGLPLRAGGAILGAIFLGTRERHAFSPEELGALALFAEHAALAIDKGRAFSDAKTRRRRLATLIEVTRELTRGPDLPNVLESIVAAAAAVFEGEAGLRLLRDGALVRVAATPGARETMRVERLPLDTGLLAAQVLRARKPALVPDISLDLGIPPEDRAAMRPERTGALMCLPVRLGPRELGTLHVYRERGYLFDDDDLTLATSLADAAAIAIENSRLFAESEQRRAAAESLAELQRAISQSLDAEVVAQRTVDALRRILRARRAALHRIDPGSGDVVVVAADDDATPGIRPGTLIPRGSGVVGLAIRERRSVVSSNLLLDERVTHAPEMRDLHESSTYRAVLAVPLIARGQVIGALGAGDAEGRVFDADEIRLAEAIADQVVLALENARLFAENARKLDELSVLYDVSRALAGRLEAEQIVETVHEQARRVVNAREMVIVLADEAQASLEAVLWMADGRREPGPRRRYPLGFGLMSRVIQERHAIRTDDYLGRCAAEGVAPSPVTARFPHWLGVPMVARDQTVGAIILRSEHPPFTEADERLLGNIADVAALAISGARLFEERMRAHREVETAQAQVLRSERLRALGEMAAGVAHDFNNTLAAISIRADLMALETTDPALRRHIGVIEQATLDGARTVRRIQEFTRLRRARPFQQIRLDQVVAEVVELTRPRWRDAAQAAGLTYHVAVEAGDVPTVAGDPSELREALTNLVFNALDAMPAGGTLGFRTGFEGGRVFCAVSDTGVGMRDEVRERVFDPFFTTKSEKGSGLGLSVVYGIVSRHGGEVDVSSEVGRGSVFTVWLPVVALHAEPLTAVVPPSAVAPARLLVVDDEPAVRLALREILTLEGHHVVACADGTEALGRLRDGEFDVVITDLSMPGMSGWDVAGRVKAGRPDTPVVLITGWGDQIDAAEAEARGVDRVLAKPFTWINLATLIQELLAPRSRRSSAPLRSRRGRAEDRDPSRESPGAA